MELMCTGDGLHYYDKSTKLHLGLRRRRRGLPAKLTERLRAS
jgi:hypothetical protein